MARNTQALLDEIERLTPRDSLGEAAFQSDLALHDFFREVVGEVEYGDYADAFTVGEFRAALRMALYELWGYERTGARAGAAYRDDAFLPATISWVAQQSAYVELRESLQSAFNRVRNPLPYRDFVESPREQQRIYMAQRRLALHATDPKVRELAARALGEKMHPTLRVAHEVKRVIHMDERTAKLLDETLRMVRERRDGNLRAGPGDSGVQRGSVEGPPSGSGREPLLLRAGHPETEPSH